MKYAVFSDIHGNAYAFEAMINSLHGEKIEGYLFCGDIVGYYYQAERIVEAFKQLPNFLAVRGNHDEMYLRALSDIESRNAAIEKYGSSYNKPDAFTTEYIQSLPEFITTNIGNFNIAMLHGSYSSPLSGRIYPDSPLDMLPLEYDFLFIGHTHYQMTRLCPKNCQIINPGSLGQPRDGKGFAYCIIDFIKGEIDRRFVDFDISPLFDEIAERDSGMPYLSDVLNRGRD